MAQNRMAEAKLYFPRRFISLIRKRPLLFFGISSSAILPFANRVIKSEREGGCDGKKKKKAGLECQQKRCWEKSGLLSLAGSELIASNPRTLIWE